MIRHLALLALIASPLAGQIVVPTDAPDLPAAVEMALPGQRILVRTLAPQPPVRIDKPLTIVGQPRLRIEIPCGQHAGVLLAGSGAGRVTLSHVDIVLGEECAFPDAAIAGDGFRELFLDDCTIDTRWTAFDGLTYGSPGIAVDLPLLTLHESQIYGGGVDGDVCVGPLPGGGHPAILAPNSDLVALHSRIQGGNGGYLCCEWCTCPSDPSSWGGHGGVGAVLSKAYLLETDMLGGLGSTLVSYPGFEQDGGGFSCTLQNDGAPLEAILGSQLTATLSGTGALALGQRWALEWAGAGDVAWVLGSSRHAIPWEFGGPGGLGTVFLEFDSLFLQVAVPLENGQGRFELTVPPVLELIGTSVGFQVLDTQSGLSAPVYRVVQS